jgi:BMFP domain-containing protein YqiC
MFNIPLENIAKRLAEVIPPEFSALREDLISNFQAVLQSTFAKFDLVTRSEFDVQAAVLAKTRAKLTALEQRMDELEQQLLNK